MKEFQDPQNKRHIPFYLSLICDFLEKENYPHGDIDISNNFEIEGSRYFYNQISFDKIIFDLIGREIIRQKMSTYIDCDRYVELLIAVSHETKMIQDSKLGRMGIEKETLIEYSSMVLREGVSEEIYMNNNPFYVSPLFSKRVFYEGSNSGSIEFFKLKYEFLENWLKTRDFMFRYSDLEASRTKIFEEWLVEFYTGKSSFLKDLRQVKSQTEFNDLENGRRILSQLQSKREDSEGSSDDVNFYKKAISGLLYFCLDSINDKTKTGYSNALISLFGSSDIYNLYIYGDFFPLDLSNLTIYHSEIRGFSCFRKCKIPSPRRVVFRQRTLIENTKPPVVDGVQSLFEEGCVLGAEIQTVIALSSSNKGEIQKRVKSDFSKIFKITYKRGIFRWRSEYVYKQDVSLDTGDLKKYLEFLVKHRVFRQVPNNFNGP